MMYGYIRIDTHILIYMHLHNRTLDLCYPDCSSDSNSMPCVTLTAQQQSAIDYYYGPTTTCAAAGICNAGYAAPAGGSCTACAPGVLVCLYVCTLQPDMTVCEQVQVQ